MSSERLRNLGIAHVGPDEERYLTNRRSEPGSFELTIREDTDSSLKSGVIMIFDRTEQMRFAARVVRRRRADELRATLLFEEFVVTNPIPLEFFYGVLKASQMSPLRAHGGTFTEKAAERVVEKLENLDGGLARQVAQWRGGKSVEPQGASPTIFEQRDATTTLLRIAGMRTDFSDPDSSEWQISKMQKTYIEGAPHEDPTIVADASSFLGWQARGVDGWGARAFSDGAGSRLTVLNINRLQAESATGADLVYYHVQRRSFVHVQYKRMHRSDLLGHSPAWLYDEDRHFARQLRQLVSLNEELSLSGREKSNSDYRLSAETGYFKFTKTEDFSRGDAALVPGQYMSARLLQSIVARNGGKLGRLRTDGPMWPYLTNTLFGDLVGHGLIGSRGADFAAVKAAIRKLAATKSSAVIGVHDEEVGRRRNRDHDAAIIPGRASLPDLGQRESGRAVRRVRRNDHLPGAETLF